MKVMHFLKMEWLQLLLLLAPFVVIPCVWDALPEQMPTHWNAAGEIDDYSSKAFGAFALPVLNILLAAFLFSIPYFDPRRENYAVFKKTMRVIRILGSSVLLLVFGITLAASLDYDVSVERLGSGALIIMFLVLGNFIGRVRSNYFVGIRTPWTLENSEVWRRTHRMTAVLWVVASLPVLPLPFIFGGELLSMIIITYLAIIVIVPVVYSFVIFKRITKSNGSDSNSQTQSSTQTDY